MVKHVINNTLPSNAGVNVFDFTTEIIILKGPIVSCWTFLICVTTVIGHKNDFIIPAFLLL
jgi:hypothetical protein